MSAGGWSGVTGSAPSQAPGPSPSGVTMAEVGVPWLLSFLQGRAPVFYPRPLSQTYHPQ